MSAPLARIYSILAAVTERIAQTVTTGCIERVALRLLYRMCNGTAPPVVAVVVGGAGGIGGALIRAFAACGYHVFAGVRSAAVNTRNTLFCHLELADMSSVHAFTDTGRDTLPWVDVLVLSAATLGDDEMCWSDVLQINTMAHAEIAERMRGLLLQSRRKPRVIAISSGDGELAYFSTELQNRLQGAACATTFADWAGDVARICGDDALREFGVHGAQKCYKLSKAALNSYVRASAIWSRGEDETSVAVAVFAVCPGDVDTDMLDKLPAADVVSPQQAVERIWHMLDVCNDASEFHAQFWRNGERIAW